MYHVNPKTGDPGVCSAKAGKCPYGDLNVHYTSKEAAREAFEQSMAGAVFADSAFNKKNWPDFNIHAKEINSRDTVFVHPQGKIAIVSETNGMKVLKNGKKATTSGSAQDLRDGRGTWVLVKDMSDPIPNYDAYVKAINDAASNPRKATPSSNPKGFTARQVTAVKDRQTHKTDLDTSKADVMKAKMSNTPHYEAMSYVPRYGGASILPLAQRGNPHKISSYAEGDNLKFWNYTNRQTGEKEVGNFEVWKSPEGNFKAVTTSGKLAALGSTQAFSHDQTGASMGGEWTLVGAFEATENGAVIGEVPNRSMPIYTYK